MGIRTTKVRVFTIADYIEEQQWLEQQHRRGWRLVKVVPPCFFVFEACEPEESVYRIEYHNRRAAADYIQMYEDYGWEYVCSCMGWNYFCKSACDISDARDKEIFSDAEDKLAMVDRIIKTRLMPVLVLLCAVLIPNVRIMMRDNVSWWGSAEGGTSIVLLVLIGIDLMLAIHCARKLRKLRKELEK